MCNEKGLKALLLVWNKPLFQYSKLEPWLVQTTVGLDEIGDFGMHQIAKATFNFLALWEGKHLKPKIAPVTNIRLNCSLSSHLYQAKHAADILVKCHQWRKPSKIFSDLRA